MKKRIGVLLGLMVLVALVGATTAGASVVRPKATYCVGGQTVGPTDNWILAYETGLYGSGLVSTDEGGIGGYWFADEDSDDVSVALGACASAVIHNPGTPNLCYSKSGSETLPFTGFTEAQGRAHLLVGDYWMATWVPGNDAAFNNVGSGHVVCNPTGKATGGYRTYSGEPVSAADAAAIIAEGDAITIYPEATS